MEFRTIVDIPSLPFRIQPLQPLLFVGSCFADGIGRRFADQQFPVTVNPYGVMYNPVSIMHTVQRWLTETDAEGEDAMPRVVFLTLGTNHVYRLKSTGEIVDNCQKRPQNLFQEEELTVGECFEVLRQTVALLVERIPDVQVVVTVSPIRYRKYGYHGSQLSKSTLLLAADRLQQTCPCVSYFPAYEIISDELRDYRFYATDMLHPSEQAADYIWERLAEACLSDAARQFIHEYAPIRQALAHKPFNPDAVEYQSFRQQNLDRLDALLQHYRAHSGK